MDTTLFEAAIRGDTETLLKLLQDDPLILDRAMSECNGKDNPLHLGALYGHVDFAREVSGRKREFARGLNSEGQSPLHVASGRGHVGVVKQILSKDAGACFVRDQDGMIPLHVAAIKGRVKVMKELVKVNITTAFVLTDKGEPILHLCANNNQFNAIRELVELVRDDNFLKLKDSDDNTILHLLAHKGKYKVINLLIKKISKEDVNAKNAVGATPLDVSVEHGSWSTDWILVGAGAKIGKTSHLKELKAKRNDHQGSWFYEALLVVAVLMITVAFQAGTNPPGGVWQENGCNDVTAEGHITASQDPRNCSDPKFVEHYAGKSIMLSVDYKRYKRFYALNLITFFSSLMVIVLLVCRRAFNVWLLEVPATILTFLSILAVLVAGYTSFGFVSGKALPLESTEHAVSFSIYGGLPQNIFVVTVLVIISLPTPFLVTRGPSLHLFLFGAIWSLKRLVHGPGPASDLPDRKPLTLYTISSRS